MVKKVKRAYTSSFYLINENVVNFNNDLIFYDIIIKVEDESKGELIYKWKIHSIKNL